MSSWKSFDNIHKGESCYIFGNGPSIKWFDLSHFKDKIAISTGQLHYHKDCGKLKNIKYFSLVEPWFFVSNFPRTILDTNRKHSELIRSLKPIVDDYKDFIQNHKDRHFFINLSNMFSLKGKHIHYVWKTLPKIRNNVDKSLIKYDLFSGSFYAALTLAYFMGFSDVYLVGFDAMTIEPVRNIRFYEFGKGEVGQNKPGDDELLNLFKNEMNIYTISNKGKSKNVTNIDYEEYTKTKPQYKENHEIMDDYYLKLIKNDPASKSNRIALKALTKK